MTSLDAIDCLETTPGAADESAYLERPAAAYCGGPAVTLINFSRPGHGAAACGGPVQDPWTQAWLRTRCGNHASRRTTTSCARQGKRNDSLPHCQHGFRKFGDVRRARQNQRI